jgi:micrococcal nuclease
MRRLLACAALGALIGAPLAAAAAPTGEVVRADGLTAVEVRVGPRLVTVRLLGLRGLPVASRCRPVVSSALADALAPGRAVRLVRDPAAPARDGAGRVPAYVVPAGGGATSVNEAIVAAGAARAEVAGARGRLARAGALLAAEARAERAGTGLWAPRCGLRPSGGAPTPVLGTGHFAPGAVGIRRPTPASPG